ncbi:MAG: SMI1/KNR4 family protein [Bacillota bacterium]
MLDLSKVQNLVSYPPASESEIDRVEREYKLCLPMVYRELLKLSNGFSIGGGLLIYGTEDIGERNLTWEVDEYAQGYVAIGDDGAGNVFLMKQHIESKGVIIVDSGYMNPIGAEEITCDLLSWIAYGCIVKSCNKNNLQILPDTCDLVLTSMPRNGTKDLLQIKNVIGIEMSIGKLLKGSKNLPFVLVKDFPYGKAMKLIECLGDTGNSIALLPRS